MTIDERLAKLAERHEALTQTVEILVAEGARLAERHEGLTQTVEIVATEGARLQKLVESHERRFEWLREDSTRIHESLTSLSEDTKRRELREEADRRGREIDARLERIVSAIGQLASGKESK